MNDPESGNTQAGASDAPPSVGSTEASTSQVAPDADTYPKYRLNFEGELVGTTNVVTGPHTLMLLEPFQQVQLIVSRNPTDSGPDLKIVVRLKE